MKRTPPTSKLAYREIRKEGLDKSLQIKIMKTLFKIRRGIRSKIASESGLSESQVWRRLSELEKKGAIEKTGRIFKSATTGRKQAEWQLTVTPE